MASHLIAMTMLRDRRERSAAAVATRRWSENGWSRREGGETQSQGRGAGTKINWKTEFDGVDEQ